MLMNGSKYYDAPLYSEPAAVKGRYEGMIGMGPGDAA